MYHRRRFQTLLLTAVFGFHLLGAECAVVKDRQKQPLTGSVTTSGESHWALLPNVKQLKKRPTSVEIYQWDKTSVDNRAPLLMVHGLLGEYWPAFRWTKLVNYLQADPEFNKRYKIIFARYDTHAPMKDVVPSFKKQAAAVSEAFGGQPLNVVALSMGGNVLQNAMTDKTFDTHIRSVLTMGTPFHGSPLFTSDWMEYSMLRHYRSPISRLDVAFAYRMYFNRHKNLLADFHWDNADRKIPDVGRFHFYFPFPSQGDLSPGTTANSFVAELNEDSSIDKSKFTVYGGYLLNDYALPKRPSELAMVLKLPYKATFTMVPEHFGREHPVLRMLNGQIARAIVSAPSAVRGQGVPYTYGLNDGITPVTSALFLPNASLSKLALADGKLDGLSGAVDVKRARLFRNIDHLTFIDDYHPLLASAELQDQLSPSESPKPIFEWIKNDLMGVNQIAEVK